MINWEQGGATSAAAICADLSLGGYNDWYLPSIEELNKMYQNIGQGNALGLGNVGGFALSPIGVLRSTITHAWVQVFIRWSQLNSLRSTLTRSCCSGFLTIYQFIHLTILIVMGD